MVKSSIAPFWVTAATPSSMSFSLKHLIRAGVGMKSQRALFYGTICSVVPSR